MKITFSHKPYLLNNNKFFALPSLYKSVHMLYLKNRNRYRHILGNKISARPNFIFNFNTFMWLKINAFQVIMEKNTFLGILDFAAAILEFCVARVIFEKSGV